MCLVRKRILAAVKDGIETIRHLSVKGLVRALIVPILVHGYVVESVAPSCFMTD